MTAVSIRCRGSRSRPARLVHRHQRRPRDGAGDGGGAGDPSSAFQLWLSFAAPLLSAPRPGIIAAAIDARHGSVYFQLFEASGRPLGPPRCDTARECIRAIGAGPAWLAGDAAAILANEAHRAGLPYDLDAGRDAPDIVALAWIGLAVDPATSPARPLYVKPPDARPNQAEPIARVPA